MIKFSLARTLLYILPCLLTFCSIQESPRRFPPSSGGLAGGQSVKTQPFNRFAWEIWPLRVDLAEREIKNLDLQRGDELLTLERRAEALRSYERALSAQLNLDEREAAVLRVASTQLSLRESGKALSTISSYFRKQGKDVDQVNSYFSLILGYAYASSGDVDQSLAWLSRAQRVSKGSRATAAAAEHATEMLIRSLAPERFEPVARGWLADPVIAGLFSAERRRRSEGGSPEGLGNESSRLYETETSGAVGVQSAISQNGLTPADGVPGEKTVLGALLPLTGKFAALGASVRNGLELASVASSNKIKLAFRDDAGDVARAVPSVNELLSQERATIIIGPLLSELGETLAASARDAGVPMLSFSKKNTFPTGGGVFRLGPTAVSQVSSLFAAVTTKLGVKRIGVVFPEDTTGSEFAAVVREQSRIYGMEVLFEAPYRRTEPDALIGLALQVEKYKPEAIFMADNAIEASRFFGALPAHVRATVVPLGPAAWDNDEQLLRSKVALDGAVFVSPFFAASSKEFIKRFRESYESRYHQKPDFLAAQGFDALTMIVAALDRQRLENLTFDAALGSVERYEGLTGQMTVQPDGEIRREFAIVRLRNGALAELQNEIPTSFVATGSGEVERSTQSLSRPPNGL